MAADERIEAALAALRRALDADAAVTAAALSERSDDRYLDVERRALDTYAPTSGLRPVSGRFAVPGGALPSEMTVDAAGVATAPVFALGRHGDAVVALVGAPREDGDYTVAEALLLSELDGVWLIAGRMGRGFDRGVAFEYLGGERFDPAAVSDPRIEQSPLAAEDAAFVQGWGR